MSSTITTRTIARWSGRVLTLVLVAGAVVGIGEATGYTPYAGAAVPTTVQPDAVANHLDTGDCGAFGGPVPARQMERGCTAVTPEDIGEDVWNTLVVLGYTGRADDGTDDLLYAPVSVIAALQDLEGGADWAASGDPA